MSSILTNNGAMVALQTLKGINKDLTATQALIATGKAVASAKDNASVWAISKIMDSDVRSFKSVSSSLALGETSIGVARQAAELVTDRLTDMKALIVSAQDENVPRGKIQSDIDVLRKQIGSIVSAAQFSGLNLLQGTDDLEVLGSLDRSSDGSVVASQITVARQDMTTAAGVFASDVDLSANAAIADSATAVTAAGNTAEITFANTWADGDTAEVTIAGLTIGYTATGALVDDIAASLAGQINALGLEGVSAANAAGVLTITSMRAFEGLNVQTTVTTAGDGDSNITAVNGAAPADDNTAANSTIAQRSEQINLSVVAAVNEGDGYKVAIGGTDYTYVAGKSETMEDVAKGLKTAIDSAKIEGVSTRVARDADTGQWSLQVDNDGTGSASLTLATAGGSGGEASGGLFGLDKIDVTNLKDARSALENIETMIAGSIDRAAAFGSAQSRLEKQSEFISSLSNSLKSGIGTLIDANMEEASARLQALQVQQQLGIQSLSIANQAPQSILSLFR